MGDLLTIAAGSPYEIVVHDVRADRIWSPRTGPNRVGPPPALVLHHTVTRHTDETPDAQYSHLLSILGGGPYGVPYSFVLFPGAEPRYWYLNDVDERHAHTYGWNHAVALGVIGNYEADEPTDALVARIIRWLGAMRSLWGIFDLPFRSHRDVYPTACPGSNLHLLTQEF